MKRLKLIDVVHFIAGTSGLIAMVTVVILTLGTVKSRLLALGFSCFWFVGTLCLAAVVLGACQRTYSRDEEQLQQLRHEAIVRDLIREEEERERQEPGSS